METKKKPNILFLMSDEHRPDVAGYAGNEIVRTPTLDYLAQTGTVFTNCYTPSPVCMPARQAMMTGKSCKHCGCRQYGEDIEPFSNTFARVLASQGYQTVCCGKLHHTGPDQMQGWTKRVSGDIQVSPPRVKTGRPAPIPGKWTDTKEVLRASISEQKRNDEYVVDGALLFIRDYFIESVYDRPRAEKPLLLKVSLTKPHYPYITSEKKFNYYLNRVQPYLNEPLFDHPFLSERAVNVGTDVSERDMKRATAAYYGMVETLDEQYAMVLNALEDAGQDLNDWLIIYTSDHGEMLGQHGVWEKRKFFEASARVPLIIRTPQQAKGEARTQNVNLCDLYATLCDYAQAPIPDDLDSRSLRPLLQDASAEWDNITISHFGREEDDGNNLMVKKDALKYQYYGEEMPEVLFDLEKDPSECYNFANDAAYAKAMEEFRKLVPLYAYEF